MAKKAVMCDDELPDHPNAPKGKKVSGHVGAGRSNSFVKGHGKGKKGRKRVHK